MPYMTKILTKIRMDVAPYAQRPLTVNHYTLTIEDRTVFTFQQ